jgi:subtilisin family serine protease
MNGVGVSGVAQRVSIMGIKFLSANGQGTTAGAIQSIDYAVAHGAKILSNSWGGPSDGDNQALSDSIERSRQRGVLFIAAAGNESKDNDGPQASYPAAFPHDNIISVAATGMGNRQSNPLVPPQMGAGDKLAFFSNYGRTSVDLGAPGERIFSLNINNGYQLMDGTSMACPHVAGAAAVVWAQNPTWNYRQVREALLRSVDPQQTLQGKTVTGGRLNVQRALQTVVN